MIPTVSVAGPPTLIWQSADLAAVLAKSGPGYLGQQRWYGAKARPLSHVVLVDVLPAAGAIPLAIALIRCEFASGPADTYQLLLTLQAAPSGQRPPGALAEVHGANGRVWLCEGTADPHVALALLAMAGSKALPAGRLGRVESLASAPVPAYAIAAVRPIGVEQSNTSIVFGQELVLKLYRKLEPGLSPDLELNRLLSDAGFAHVPRFRGALEYVGTGEPIALALLQDYVPNQGDGWADALHSVKGYLIEPTQEALHAYATRVRLLGQITGRMHQALASAATEASMLAEPVTAADVRAWQAGWQAHWQQIVPQLQALGHDVTALQPQLHAAAARFETIRHAGAKIRHHGDYHLGQVLRLAHDWLILDFEGEPARSLAERRAKQSPLRDVAGMMRSFSYAAQVGLREHAGPDHSAWRDLSSLALAWEHAARQAFWQGYLDVMHDSGLLPPDGSERRQLLALFELDKAIYELGYELNNRPAWVSIPLAGIQRLVEA